MSFVKNLDEIMKLNKETADFYDAEIITIYWETKPEIVKRLLPRPLKPIGPPLAFAFIANYPKTNFSLPYFESALGLLCQFKGEIGAYILAMPVTNDIAMAGGREFYGYPKKMASIQLKREGNNIEGWTDRLGTRIIHVKGEITGSIPEKETQKTMSAMGFKENVMVIYNFKHFPAPEGMGFDYNPRLIREEVEFNHKSVERANVKIELKSSEFDPWAEVEVVNLMGAMYTIGDNKMRKGSVAAEVKPTTFAQYAFLKWDLY